MKSQSLRIISLTIVMVSLCINTTFAKTKNFKKPTKKAIKIKHECWTGGYVGFNTGYSWARAKFRLETHFAPSSYLLESDIEQLNNIGRFNSHFENFIGGVQTGYNYQLNESDYLLGFETDFNLYNSAGNNTLTEIYTSAPPYSFALSSTARTNWLYTLRARMGLTCNCSLFYVTGGLAVTQLKTYHSFSDDLESENAIPSNAFESDGESQIKAGGVIGAGYERALSEHLLLKVEYLFVDIGKVFSSGLLQLNPAFSQTFPELNATNPLNHHASFTANIVRLGINYKFC